MLVYRSASVCSDTWQSTAAQQLSNANWANSWKFNETGCQFNCQEFQGIVLFGILWKLDTSHYFRNNELESGAKRRAFVLLSYLSCFQLTNELPCTLGPESNSFFYYVRNIQLHNLNHAEYTFTDIHFNDDWKPRGYKNVLSKLRLMPCAHLVI